MVRVRCLNVDSDDFQIFSCRFGTSGWLQDTVHRYVKTDGISGPEQRQISLSKVYKHFQSEEQFVLTHKIRMRSVTEIRLSVLRLRIEEIFEYTCTCTSEASRVQCQRYQCVA